jgi:ERCC4-type nuclease
MTLQAILLAHNEPPWVKELKFDVPTTVTQIVGDAWLACEDATIIVERKTVIDLLNSIADKRLFNQCSEMLKISAWCYLTITGYPKILNNVYWIAGKPSKWTWRQVEGALATVQQLGITVIRNIPETAAAYTDTLRWLARRERGPVRLEPRRDSIMPSAGEQVLMSLPGIGQKRAQGYIKRFGTAGWTVCHLTQDETGAIAKSARQAYGLEDDQFMAILTKEPKE